MILYFLRHADAGSHSMADDDDGIACVEFPGVPEPGAGELAWLLDPDMYGA